MPLNLDTRKLRYFKISIEKGERISKIKYLSNDRLFTTIFVRIFLIDPAIRGTESQSDKGVMNHEQYVVKVTKDVVVYLKLHSR